MAEWHYMHLGQQLGPISEEAIRAMVASGEVLPEDLVWCDGMAEWSAAGALPELAQGPILPAIDPPVVNFSPVSVGYAPPPHVRLGKSYDGVAFGGLFLACFGLFCGGMLVGLPAIACGIIALVGMRKSKNRAGRGVAIAAIIIGAIVAGRHIVLLLEVLSNRSWREIIDYGTIRVRNTSTPV